MSILTCRENHMVQIGYSLFSQKIQKLLNVNKSLGDRTQINGCQSGNNGYDTQQFHHRHPENPLSFQYHNKPPAITSNGTLTTPFCASCSICQAT